MSAALSRRAAIGAFATMPIAVATASSSPNAVDPSKWKEAFARWRAADALWDSFLDNIYNPAIEELDRRALAPPSSFMVTAKSGATQIYFHDREVPDAWTANLSHAISGPAQQLRDQWSQYQRDYDSARNELRIDELSAEEDRLAANATKARYELLATPVSDAAELLQKMEIAWAPGCDPDLFRDELFRDFRHLAIA